MSLTVIYPKTGCPDEFSRLDEVLTSALQGIGCRILDDIPESEPPRGERLLFVIGLDPYGINFACTKLLAKLRRDPDLLEGCTSAILVDCDSEFYTKSAAAELAFALNCAGSALIGRPLVEGTGSLANFRVQAKLLGTDCYGAYKAAVRDLAERLLETEPPVRKHFSLLALHASSHRTSNTMQLWGKVSRLLGDSADITEIGLRNGTISDCSGCPYTMCVHFGEKGRCFYGGLMQEEVWPAVLKADGLIMLCPNYNDALSANLTAFINRLTGLFRQQRFYDKAVFAIIVSGYSGGDIIARQVISALNMNKSFYLPPHFALMETANDPGEALQLPGIDGRIRRFAENITRTFSG